MDRDFAVILYRALMMICRYLEKRYGFGGVTPEPQYHVEMMYEKHSE